MVIKENENNVILSEVSDFNLYHIFDCGQCFRFYESGKNEFTGVAKSRAVTIRQSGDTVTFLNTSLDDFKSIWYDYLDLGRDYGEVKKALSGDECMNKAISEGYGIRILKQDLFETMISFIISQSNNIPRIKSIIEKLCNLYGEKISYNGKEYSAFPTAEAILENDLAPLRAGYRDKYIKDCAKTVYRNPDILEELKTADTASAKKILMSLNGIGNKVSDCILLFGLGKSNSFPVDVWMKRIMEKLYFKKECSISEITDYASAKFGDYSGLAQQYLFYYALNHKNELSD